jgi:ABC-type phosphate transport system auxiliary subunit
MEIQNILDYLLDVSKVLVAGLLTFVLYNINNKRAENRKQITSEKEMIMELREDKILQAISGLKSDMDGKFQTVNNRLDSLQTGMDGKFTSLKSDMDGKFQAVNTRLDSLQTDISQIIYHQGLLVMELKTLGVIKETPVIK